MSESGDRLLRQTYSEILQGFSIVSYKDNRIFIHHSENLNELESDFLYAKTYNTSVSKGYPTKEERLVQLEQDKLWSEGDQNNLEGIQASINSLQIAKKKAFLKKDIDSINSQITEQEALYSEMAQKRELLIGPTAEKFTRRIVDAFVIQQSFYKSLDPKKLLYSEEEFEELDSLDLSDLFVVYNQTMDRLSELNIKKIALSSFFQNYFMLADNLYYFYGKPLCELTVFQIRLGMYGNYYKTILSSDAKPPEELLSDPEKLEDWYTSITNAEDMLKRTVKEDDADVSIIGATKEDLKNWGYEQQGSSLREATRKAGGVLDKEAMMKLAGIG